MTITFAGKVIAQDVVDGGTDGVEGFEPSGKQQVQSAEYLRATDAVPMARGNRVHTLKGQIHSKVFPSSALALASLLQRYAGLAQAGALSFTEGGQQTTFPVAVLETFASERIGCTYTIELSFVASAPAVTVPVLVTDAGVPIVTDSGASITTNPATAPALVTDAGAPVVTDAGAPINLNFNP